MGVVDNVWTRSYFGGLLGGLVSGLAALGVVWVGAVMSLSAHESRSGPFVAGLTIAPFIYALGPATGVNMHGSAHDGRSGFGRAFLGSLLGQLVASAPLLLLATDLHSEIPIFMSLGAGLIAAPFFASWGYWSQSNRRIEEDQARSSVQWMPTVYFTPESGGLGVAGSF